MTCDHRAIMEAIQNADVATLKEVATYWSGFPSDVDDSGQHWIINATHSGNGETVDWMLVNGASPLIQGDDGYTVLHIVIEESGPDKYLMMRALIAAGADVNEIGIHGYTPAHLAAVRNDVEALRILHENGADFSIKTTVDDYYTPLEEARSLRKRDASDAICYLEAVEAGMN